MSSNNNVIFNLYLIILSAIKGEECELNMQLEAKINQLNFYSKIAKF